MQANICNVKIFPKADCRYDSSAGYLAEKVNIRPTLLFDMRLKISHSCDVQFGFMRLFPLTYELRRSGTTKQCYHFFNYDYYHLKPCG